jgi:hypothetical protein
MIAADRALPLMLALKSVAPDGRTLKTSFIWPPMCLMRGQ